MKTAWKLSAATATLILISCATADKTRTPTPYGQLVTVGTLYERGTGAVISSREVMTIYHTVDSGPPYAGGRPARIVAIDGGSHSSDPIVILEVDIDFFSEDDDWDDDSDRQQFHPFPKGIGNQVVTRHGSYGVKENRTVPGDSGSPVIDLDGRLVGIVRGTAEYPDGRQETSWVRLTAWPLLRRSTQETHPGGNQ